MSTEELGTKRLTAGTERSQYRRPAVFAALLLSAFCFTPSPSAQPRTSPSAHSFFDPFDGLDGRRWSISDGWVNGGHQGCTWSRAAVDIKKGMLRLSVVPRANHLRPLVCGEIQALGGAYGYGTYEARMRVAAGSGLNTAMFTYSGPPITPVHDEIDFEFLGKSPQTVQLNYFVGARGGHESITPIGADASADFHNYAFVWEPDKVRWFIDGKLVRTETGVSRPRTAGKFYLSLWSGTPVIDGWLGALDQRSIPASAFFDWVAYTAPGETCRFTESVTCKPL